MLWCRRVGEDWDQVKGWLARLRACLWYDDVREIWLYIMYAYCHNTLRPRSRAQRCSFPVSVFERLTCYEYDLL